MQAAGFDIIELPGLRGAPQFGTADAAPVTMSPTTKRLEEVIAAERNFWDHANDPAFFKQAFTDDALLTMIEPMGFIAKQQAIEMANEAESWTNVLMQDVKCASSRANAWR